MHAPSILRSPEFSRDPSLLRALARHPQYYGLIRLPRQLPSPSLPYSPAFGGIAFVLGLHDWVGGVSQVPFCLTMSSLTPRRCHRPSVPDEPRSVARHDDADFIHEIGTRPPHPIFTRLPVRSLVLQPGHLRSTLTGYIVESLSVVQQPTPHRLLATCLHAVVLRFGTQAWLQSLTTFGTWRKWRLPPHPNRIGTA